MYDLTIRLDSESDSCLYEQIYQHIKNEIKSGKLLAGERLPSTRSLAIYLQVARSTVDYAYGQLTAEGYIEARPCKGYYVCAMEELLQMEREKDNAIMGKSVAESSEAKQEYQYDFSPHEIDMSGFPFSVWKKITKNILTDANSELFSRGEPQGDLELRKTICRYLYSARGVNCTPEQVIVGAGNDYLLLFLERLLGSHLRIAMENPTYLRPYRIFKSYADDILTVDMDESGLKVEQLEHQNVNAVYVMPSHQFPAGIVMPIGRRLELLKWAGSAPNRYIIEDDYDSEFRYHGKPIPALMASDGQGNVIYIGSFSKSIAPAIRVSFMVLPRDLLEKYKRDCSFYSCTVSRIDQSILNEFIRDGYFERHLNKMRNIYKYKHELLLEELKCFREDFMISGENAGLHLLLTSKTNRKETELIQKAAEGGIKLYGMSEYMAVPGTETNTVILGFGNLSAGQIAEGIQRLRDVWN